VTGEDGRTLVGRKQAEGEAKLVLHFRDGTLDVAPVEGTSPSPARKPRPAKPVQDDLFG